MSLLSLPSVPALPAVTLSSLTPPSTPSPPRQRQRNKRKAALQLSGAPSLPPSSAVPAVAQRSQRRSPRRCEICGKVLPWQERLREHLISDHHLLLLPDVKTKWDPELRRYTQSTARRVGHVAPAVDSDWAAAPLPTSTRELFRPVPTLPSVGAAHTVLRSPLPTEHLAEQTVPSRPASAASAHSLYLSLSPGLLQSLYTDPLSPQPMPMGSSQCSPSAGSGILIQPHLPMRSDSFNTVLTDQRSLPSLFNVTLSPTPSWQDFARQGAFSPDSSLHATFIPSSPAASPQPFSRPRNGGPAQEDVAARAEVEAQAAVSNDPVISSNPVHSSSDSAPPAMSTGLCGADCARCTHRGLQRQPPSTIMHCKDCALSSSSSNFHLCSQCFLEMKARCMQSHQPFTLLTMCPLLGPVDGSDESVADHVAKHDFTCVYNRYTTYHGTFIVESLKTPLPLQSSPPRSYHTSDICTDLVTRVFKLGCMINDLIGCLDHARWRWLQTQLIPNYFDMSVFYHQASEHQFLSLLFWVRSNILENHGRLALQFLDGSGLPHLQRLRATSDMASTVFDRWQERIRIRYPERAQHNIHALNFSILEKLILALGHKKLVDYFMRDCFKEAFEGFTCGPRPQRTFRQLNERMRIVIDDQPEALHELLFEVLSPVCELIEPGSTVSATAFSLTLGGYLSDVYYVGEELRTFWYWRSCRHTMSALSYRILEEYGAADTTIDTIASRTSIPLSPDEHALVFLVGDVFDVLCPREPVSSEDCVVLQRVVQTGNGRQNRLWHLLDRLVSVMDGSFEHRRSSGMTVQLILQLVNLLIYTWRGFDEADLKAALWYCCERQRFNALSRILTAHVSWSPNKLHMMELMKVLPRQLERLANRSLRSRLMPRTINRLRAAAHPTISHSVQSAAPQEAEVKSDLPTSQAQEESDAEEGAKDDNEVESGHSAAPSDQAKVTSDHPTSETQLELLLWREEKRRAVRMLSSQIEEISCET